MKIGQSDYRAEANAENSHGRQPKADAQDNPRLPSKLDQES